MSGKGLTADYNRSCSPTRASIGIYRDGRKASEVVLNDVNSASVCSGSVGTLNQKKSISKAFKVTRCQKYVRQSQGFNASLLSVHGRCGRGWSVMGTALVHGLCLGPGPQVRVKQAMVTLV